MHDQKTVEGGGGELTGIKGVRSGSSVLSPNPQPPTPKRSLRLEYTIFTMCHFTAHAAIIRVRFVFPFLDKFCNPITNNELKDSSYRKRTPSRK